MQRIETETRKRLTETSSLFPAGASRARRPESLTFSGVVCVVSFEKFPTHETRQKNFKPTRNVQTFRDEWFDGEFCIFD